MDVTDMMEKMTKDEKEITSYQRGCMVRSKSKRILQILESYADDPETLEEMKNRISDERDYYDMVDLVPSLKKRHRKRLLNLFNFVDPIDSNSPYFYKMMVDIDNTTIENSVIAPIYYVDKMIIPGLMPILSLFTGAGQSTTTFLSARPKEIESLSIKGIEEHFDNNFRYAIQTGSLKPIAMYMKGKLLGDDEDLEKSYLEMANEKYENFKKLFAIHPQCKFIFMGDNTQGDPYLAYKLVKTKNNQGERICAWTAIRIVGDRQYPHKLYENKRILFHSSYYELAYLLAKNEFANPKTLLKLVKQDYKNNYVPEDYDPDQAEYDKKYLDELKNLVKLEKAQKSKKIEF